MARIAGVTVPNKRAEIALTYIFGIGLTRSNKILEESGIDKNVRINILSEEDLNKLRSIIKEKFIVEGDLRREKMLAIRRLRENGSYRGTRHTKRLPARGQSSRRNSRTVRGNVKKSVGSGRKPSAQKT